MTWIGLTFLYLPLIVIAVLSFNKATSLSWPPQGFTLSWWHKAWDTDAPREALLNSVQVALAATAIALVLGTLAAFAMQRHRFFGQHAISYLLVLPISLPGIVTAVALQNSFSRTIPIGWLTWIIGRPDFALRVGFGFRSLVIAHATFCVVLAYNNVVARLRRSSPNLLEASADLGASGWQTFRHITFPLMRTALVSGGILAFALSFDEIIVTTFTAGPGFQTLPQWILANVSRPNNVPLVNVIATFVMCVSIPLAWLAQRLGEGGPSS